MRNGVAMLDTSVIAFAQDPPVADQDRSNRQAAFRPALGGQFEAAGDEGGMAVSHRSASHPGSNLQERAWRRTAPRSNSYQRVSFL